MNDNLLRSIPLFESLSKDARTFIVKRLKTETFASGEVIVRQGDTGDSLYIITSGLVKVTKREKTGASRELARLRAGDCFGEMSLLAGQPRSADIITVTDTTTLVLCKDDMDQILEEYPTIAVHFSKVLSKRLRDTSQLKLETKRSVSVISLYSRHVDSLLQTVLAINLAVSFTKELMKRVGQHSPSRFSKIG
jgi:potassium efflux system protein